MLKIHIVSDTKTNEQFIVNDYDIKGGLIKTKHWSYDDCSEGFMEHVSRDIKVEYTFLVNITAEFAITPDGINAYTSNRGFRSVNGLMYFYSVVIVESFSDHSLYESNLVHSESGIKTTNHDMYSYHLNEPFRYLNSQILYEVENGLDFKQILTRYLRPTKKADEFETSL
jgi:hypothetical protein